uniref:Ig-like domain-containing protein n=1 Tax=Dicentrarchus labrax TaxID=13489 RepID=A0A8C4NX30_DICLA
MTDLSCLNGCVSVLHSHDLEQMMNRMSSWVWVILSVRWTVSGGDTQVSCVFMESCILPCSFQGGANVVIHWIQVTAGNTPIHSYFYNQDQYKHQDQRFRGRTSLFKDQISGGNASLQLTGVEIQDQGRYKCSTKTINWHKDSFIILTVDAPVRKVDIQQVENRITCSSEGIYPEPKLTWFSNPPSNVTLENTSTVKQNEQQLYNISSSLLLPDSVTDRVYTCNVITRRNSLRTSLKHLRSQTGVTVIIVPVVVGVVLSALLAGLLLFYINKKERDQTSGLSDYTRCSTTTKTLCCSEGCL